MKKNFYSVLALASFALALCWTLQLGASETSLLDENFAAITRSAGPGGSGGGGDYPDGPGGEPVNPPDSPFLRGYTTAPIKKYNHFKERYEEVLCCVKSFPSNGCDVAMLRCVEGVGPS